MSEAPGSIRGRGAGSNPSSRFDRLTYEPDPDERLWPEDEKPSPRTQLFRDTSKTVLTENDSPDVGFRYSVNPYRGCEHGCAYCYARPTHEYLGYSAGLDFETKIFVKEKAPELLRERLMSPRWRPECIAFSGVTDCYQPIERRLRLTRACLEVMADFRHPTAIITKNHLVTRDVDLLRRLAELDAVIVFLSVTSLDAELISVLEPRTSRPPARLEAIRILADNGIPVGVNIAPVIPGLTDHEIPAILKAAAEAGASFAGYGMLRLPLTVAPLFTEWLRTHRPLRANKVVEAVRSLRGGRLNDPRFGSRMRGEGAFASQVEQLFRIHARREGLNRKNFELSSEHFSRPGDQLALW